MPVNAGKRHFLKHCPCRYLPVANTAGTSHRPTLLENPTINRLQFRHIAEEDTMKAIDNLENKNSSGHDGISNKLLKSITYNELCKPLTLIINQMLSSGVFTETFKNSKIIPLYKKGDSSLLSNYRPISLLPTISKIFERILYNQLYQYFNDNELLAVQQYDFHAPHSTEYAAIKLFDHVSKEMDSGNTPTALYIDLSKAFDTLSFDIILQKLKHYGVMGTELRLLTAGLAGSIYRRYLPPVFTSKYRHGLYSQKWRLPAFTGIYKYFIDFSSNYIFDSPSYALYYTWTP